MSKKKTNTLINVYTSKLIKPSKVMFSIQKFKSKLTSLAHLNNYHRKQTLLKVPLLSFQIEV